MAGIALVTRRRFDQLLDHNDQMRSYVQFLRMKVAEGRVGVDELPHGLPTELRKEYLTCHLGRTNTRMKSEDLGVSGMYLTALIGFREDLDEAIGSFDAENTTFSNLKE